MEVSKKIIYELKIVVLFLNFSIIPLLAGPFKGLMIQSKININNEIMENLKKVSLK